MRDISSVGRKRKQHKTSTAAELNPSTVLEDFSSRDSLEGSFTSSSVTVGESPPSHRASWARANLQTDIQNFETEGIVTSSKRIKPNTRETNIRQRDSNFHPIAESRLAVVTEVGHSLRPSMVLEQHKTEKIDDEAFGHIALPNKRSKLAGAASDSILARYNKGPPNNLPDYGYNFPTPSEYREIEALIKLDFSPTDVPNAVALAPGRSGTIMGEKKSVGLPVGFLPRNTLQRGGGGNNPLPRPNQEKAFDLHGSSSSSTSGDYRSTKRQKTGSDSLARVASPISVVDLSREGTISETVRNTSSKALSSKKTVQSDSQSLKQRQPTESILGTNDSYKNVEKIVGFENSKTIPALQRELQKKRLPDGMNGTSQSQQYKQRKMESRDFDFTRYRSADTIGNEQPVSSNDEKDDIEEVSPNPPKNKGTANLSASRAKDERKLRGQRKINSRKLVTSSSTPFETGSRNCKDMHASQAQIDDNLLNSTLRVGYGSGETPSTCGEANANELDVNQDLDEDSVDLVNPEVFVSESRSGTTSLESITTSESIATEGDIPRSTFSSARLKTAGAPKQPAIRSDLDFRFVYLGDGGKEINSKSDSDPWHLRFNNDKREFDVLHGGLLASSGYENLILKLDKILSIKFNDESSKLVILRSSEAKSHSNSQLLLEIHSERDASRFVSGVRDMGINITTKLIECTTLDRTFDNARKAKAKYSNQLPHRKPEDLILMEVKEARGVAGREKARCVAEEDRRVREDNHHVAEAENRQSRLSGEKIVQFADQKLSGGTQAALPTVDSRSMELITHNTRLFSLKQISPKPETFYQSSIVTRSLTSGRNGDKSFVFPRSLSPSPLGWTKIHPGWMENKGWKTSLIFPIEGKKRATVDARDVERLDEGEFLNDNIIAFYLRYLEYNLDKSHSHLARRIYFQNTFFYETLTKDKVRSNNINYDAVKRWTSKVDLFSYDYVIVPVCEKLHWYVAIICNLPKLLENPEAEKFDERDLAESLAGPPESPTGCNEEDGHVVSKAAKTFDNAPPLEVLLDPKPSRSISPTFQSQVEQMSLKEQGEWPESEALPSRDPDPESHFREVNLAWTDSSPMKTDPSLSLLKGRKPRKAQIGGRKYDPKDPRIITLDSLGGTHSPTCLNLRAYLVCEAKERHDLPISPGRLGMTAKGLPQQSNYCDCGIFVLGYVERFLNDPDLFVHDILQGSISDKVDWADLEASKMRENIRDLIFKLHTEQVNRDKEGRDARLRAKKLSTMEPKSISLGNGAGRKSQPRHGSPRVTSPANHQMSLAPEVDDIPSPTNAFRPGDDENSISLPNPREKDTSSPATSDEQSDLSEVEPMGKSQGSSQYIHVAEPRSARKAEIPDIPARYQDKDISASLANSDSCSGSPPNSAPPSKPALNQLKPIGSYIMSEATSSTSSSEELTMQPSTAKFFTEYVRSSSSLPHQSSHRTAPKRGTSPSSPLEIDKSPRSQREKVRETPRPSLRQVSFEDLLAQESSKSPKHHIQDSLVSEHSSQETRASRRNSERKTASPEVVIYENGSRRVLRAKSNKPK